jgi:hypothetical protein
MNGRVRESTRLAPRCTSAFSSSFFLLCREWLHLVFKAGWLCLMHTADLTRRGFCLPSPSSNTQCNGATVAFRRTVPSAIPAAFTGKGSLLCHCLICPRCSSCTMC